MPAASHRLATLILSASLATSLLLVRADEPAALPRAFVDGTGTGWRALGEADFTTVNSDPDTWTWADGEVHGTGKPVSVARSVKPYTNFEFVAEWRHLKSGGNSGFFAWVPEKAIEGMAPGKAGLPDGGVEIQVLENGFRKLFEEKQEKRGEKARSSDFFTTHGDVFAVGTSKMTPFPPTSPNGSRSFPSKHLSKGVGEWNHYYVRAINGEIRLWVNGEEVSGGTGCEPRVGYLCLESEGSPVEFRHLRIRELP